MYNCTSCEYKTTRAFDLERHKNKKRPCPTYTVYKHTRNDSQNAMDAPQNVMVSPQNVMVSPQNVMVSPQNVMVSPQNVTDSPQNVTDSPQNIMDTPQPCVKCYKLFARIDSLKRHESKCDGLDKRQCKICLKLFSTRQSKSEHTKYVKCNPPQNITNNITNNNQKYITTNNNQQYITNNIRLSFGNENVKHLCDEAGYMKRMEEYVQMLKYAIPRSIEDVFFNDDYPENQTVKKDRKNDDLINVHIGDGKWENRLTKDTMDSFLNTIQNYMEKYIGTVKLNPVVRSRLKAFGKEMSKVKEWSTESIEDRLDIEPYMEPNEDDLKKTKKSICKLINAKLYEETK